MAGFPGAIAGLFAALAVAACYFITAKVCFAKGIDHHGWAEIATGLALGTFWGWQV